MSRLIDELLVKEKEVGSSGKTDKNAQLPLKHFYIVGD